VKQIGLSERQACIVATCNRRTYRRKLIRSQDPEILELIHKFAAKYQYSGYRRLAEILYFEDIAVVNHKRVYRLYRAAELQLPARLKRRVDADDDASS
jgi:putative transposase